MYFCYSASFKKKIWLIESFDILLENVSRKLVIEINRYDEESQYI